MTALPASASFTGSSVTEAQFKAAITDLHDYLAALLGTDGLAVTALATVGASLSSYLSKSAAYTTVQADKGKVIDCTTGTWTLGLHAAATAGNGFTIAVRNSGSGVITLDPNASETIDGVTTTALAAGESALLYCTGTAWLSVGKTNNNQATTGVLISVDYVTATGAYTKTAPTGATRARVKVQAGGGNGGADGGAGGGGGGGGGYAEKLITGLTGGVSTISGSVGAAASASTITSPVTVTANGGASASGQTAGTGGTASGGDLNMSGQAGRNATGSSDGGRGGSSTMGVGGHNGASGNGGAGFGFGAGGGGGAGGAGGAGAGASGIVQIEWLK